MPRLGRWLAYAFAAIMIVLIVESAWFAPGTAITAPKAAARMLSAPVPYPPDHRTALADADRALATAQMRAADNPGWLAEEMLARAHFERARLTDSLADFVAAEQALARSMNLAPPRSGPHLLQAVFDLAMHRLDDAEAQLDRIMHYAIPPEAGERAQIEAMRGDIAFYRGRYERALRHYDRAEHLDPGSAEFRRAYFHATRGDLGRGLMLLDRAERGSGRPSVQLAARMELQRGVFSLEAGAVRRARTHFARAEALFPGDWVIEEHVAEAHALLGHREDAERRYRDIVERTQSPLFMDKLAGLARQRNDEGEARSWSQRAAAAWRARLAAFPEAYYAPAAEHCLAVDDRDCALRLARLNYRARPYGEAAALLAEVLTSAGQERQARELAAAVDRTGWRSARTRRLAALLAPSR